VVIAGGAVRSVMDLSGVKNVVCKMLGSNNKVNNVKAVFRGVFQDEEQRRALENAEITDKHG